MTRAANMTPAPFGLPAGAAPAAWTQPLAVIRQWSERRRSRLALRQLNTHLLRDVGIDPFAADAEAAQPFWR